MRRSKCPPATIEGMELRTCVITARGSWSACITMPGDWVIAGMAVSGTEERAIGQLARSISKDIVDLEILLKQKREALRIIRARKGAVA